MEKSNETQAMGLQLTKSSTEEQIRQYFMSIVELNHSEEEYPINLDDVWPLVYSRKDAAIRQLRSDFIEGDDYVMKVIDFHRFHQNVEKGGDLKTQTYYLSVPCLEYLVVRKVRAVFEVYRQVFHRVANGGVILFGDNKYYTLSEYCRMFEKTANSFYGLMAAYREEFAMIGRTYYVSKPLCRMIEMRSHAEQVRRTIREKSDKAQLEFEFKAM